MFLIFLWQAMATVDDIALTMHRGLGARGAAWLLSVFGTAEAVYKASAEELRLRARLRDDLTAEIARKSCHSRAEAEIRYLRRHGLAAVASTDEDYPPMLAECPDYPHVLYAAGNVRALALRTITIVGTRRVTPYGQRTASRLVAELARCAPDAAVASGMAFGVDAACHRAALEEGAPAVAVLANPLPGVSPAQHASLARRIIDAGGVLVSELRSEDAGNPGIFVQRNRILAGMSAGTVVVESPLRGGSLITAALADGYERAVMAVPGRADDPSSAGCNQLIRSRRAQCVCCARDIMEELGWDTAPTEAADAPPPQEIPSGPAGEIVRSFGPGETLDADTVAQRTGFGTAETNALLMELEIGGVLRRLPGKMYERV